MEEKIMITIQFKILSSVIPPFAIDYFVFHEPFKYEVKQLAFEKRDQKFITNAEFIDPLSGTFEILIIEDRSLTPEYCYPAKIQIWSGERLCEQLFIKDDPFQGKIIIEKNDHINPRPLDQSIHFQIIP